MLGLTPPILAHAMTLATLHAALPLFARRHAHTTALHPLDSTPLTLTLGEGSPLPLALLTPKQKQASLLPLQ